MGDGPGPMSLNDHAAVDLYDGPNTTEQEMVTAAADHHGPDRPVVLWLGGLSAARYTETELVPLAPTPRRAADPDDPGLRPPGSTSRDTPR